jgi:four helix bundle protein
MQIKSFRDLRVWQAGIELVQAVYVITSNFPRHELYGLASQIQRAAVSVPSNIAEGHARESTKEYLQHLSIAQASLAELETQIEIAKKLKYISEDDASRLFENISSLGRQLSALRNALTNSKARTASPGS